MKNLSIRSESIERIFSYYQGNMFIVNRRYQRKLVWTQEEKASFINSIYNKFPVPLILLAQDKNSNFEIIDGMQRLNAITSFILGEFSIKIGSENYYFDLDSISETKMLKDNKALVQKNPILDRKICVDIASYPLPISITEIKSHEDIDNVFRRINSGGRHLSRQEIRQAGVLSNFAIIVRNIASEIRGDRSSTEIVNLNNMHKISITNKALDYGICVDDLFWVKNSIIRREDVRESKDEELIAEILAFMLLDDITRSSTDILDEFYGLNESDSSRADDLNTKISFLGVEKIEGDFFKVFNLIKRILDEMDIAFNDLLFGSSRKEKIPRYFQIVLFSLYDLLIKENKVPKDMEMLKETLKDSGKHINLSSGGGTWSAKEKTALTSSYKGLLNSCFIKNEEKLHNPAYIEWNTQLENILNYSSVENTNYDFKVSFYDFNTRNFNENVLSKCIKTLTAIANQGKGRKGFVIVGVADKDEDAKKVRELTKKNNVLYKNFHITGIELDLQFNQKTLEQYFNFIVDKIKGQPLETNYLNYILENIRVFSYRKKPLLKLEIKGLDSPAAYNEEYYERHGSNTQKLTAREAMNLTRKF